MYDKIILLDILDRKLRDEELPINEQIFLKVNWGIFLIKIGFNKSILKKYLVGFNKSILKKYLVLQIN